MIEAEIRAVQYPLQGASNGKKESTIKGKHAAAVHLNNSSSAADSVDSVDLFQDGTLSAPSSDTDFSCFNSSA